MSIIPPTQKTWHLQTQDGWEKGLVLIENEKVPQVLGNDVLVKFHAASLNYRDLIIAKGTSVVSKMRPGVVPGSDGAGEVVAVGDKVSRFVVGDSVVTLFNQGHFSGELDSRGVVLTGVGGMVDGTLRQYGVFNEQGLVSMPRSLGYLEASTLSCAAVTAWNAFFGGGKQLKPGSTILTQGTGGVSLFALQFALSAGATVIATTSSPSKTTLLKSLGATHVINYKETPNWGDVVKGLTYEGEGVDFVVEVGGPSTMRESLKAVRIGGVVNLIGVVAGRGGDVAAGGREVGFLDVLVRGVTVRGIMVGGRDLLVDMIKAIDENQIKPVIDEKVFELEELKEAYQYMSESKHVGKVVVRIV